MAGSAGSPSSISRQPLLPCHWDNSTDPSRSSRAPPAFVGYCQPCSCCVSGRWFKQVTRLLVTVCSAVRWAVKAVSCLFWREPGILSRSWGCLVECCPVPARPVCVTSTARRLVRAGASEAPHGLRWCLSAAQVFIHLHQLSGLESLACCTDEGLKDPQQHPTSGACMESVVILGAQEQSCFRKGRIRRPPDS